MKRKLKKSVKLTVSLTNTLYVDYFIVNIISVHTHTTLSQFPMTLFALEKKFEVLSV